MKKLLAVALVSASTGALGAGVLLATDGHALGSRPSISAATDGADAGGAETEGCDRREHRRARVVQATLRVAAEAIGITPEELRAELADGGSIADVATDHGIDPATVEAALLDALEERIATLVERDRLDPERADEILDRAEDRIHEAVTKVRPAHPSGDAADASA